MKCSEEKHREAFGTLSKVFSDVLDSIVCQDCGETYPPIPKATPLAAKISADIAAKHAMGVRRSRKRK
jgi:hypothetical protein